MSDLTHNCPNCSKTFDKIKGLRTHHGIVHENNLDNNVCDDCGKSFYSKWGNKKYCEGCFSFEGEKNPNYKNKKEASNCKVCGDEFYYYPSDTKGIYCYTCQADRPWVTKDDTLDRTKEKISIFCHKCDKKLKRLPSEVSERNFCSDGCQYSWLSNYYEGSGHPNWVKGYNSNYANGWWSVKRDALKRDDYTCQICGKAKEEIGRNPDVHHIIPVRLFNEQKNAHKLDNVICLCPKCHRQTEPKDLSTKSI